MKIVINKTRAAIYAGGKLLIPGTNVLEDDGIDENKDDMKSFIEGGSVVVKDTKNLTAEDKKDAVGNINDRGNLKKLKELVLDANQLETLPEALAECDSLETISVVENPMEGGIPRVLLDKKGLSIDQ